ncbi:MAG: hypothetical protein JEZ09_21515 [Salinivirgaceae bacterium]|nr:hypothetical protein [Salinivirgaceae bacterium]
MENPYNEIIKVLDKISTDLEKNKSNKAWTARIKTDLTKLGVDNQCKTCTAGIDDASGEFLFDLIWYKNKDKLLASIELAMESEWNISHNSIFYDFEKLLATNARYRLLICQSNPDEIQELEDKFRSYIKGYSLLEKGSNFLIAIWNNYTRKFVYFNLVK